jgi:hypothetical protein
LDPIDEQPKTYIDSEFDKKVNSGSRVDTPLLEKRVDSLVEGGREYLDGTTRHLLSPRTTAKGTYDITTHPFFRSSKNNAVNSGVVANKETARGCQILQQRRLPRKGALPR